MLISTIVVADDGSDHAAVALDMAVDLALKFDARLVVAHVFSHEHPTEDLQHFVEVEHLAGSGRVHAAPPDTATLVTKDIPVTDVIAEQRVITVLGEQIVKNAVNKATESGVKNVAAVTRSGDYANGILEIAKEQHADMIVMGRRGLTKLKGLLFGSVSQKVSQRAECSVLLAK